VRKRRRVTEFKAATHVVPSRQQLKMPSELLDGLLRLSIVSSKCKFQHLFSFKQFRLFDIYSKDAVISLTQNMKFQVMSTAFTRTLYTVGPVWRHLNLLLGSLLTVNELECELGYVLCFSHVT